MKLRRILLVLGLVLAALVAYGVIAVLINRGLQPVASVTTPESSAELRAAGQEITLTTWNLGYGGLGEGSEFIADGGNKFFPPSREAVAANINGIVERLSGFESDIILLQEVAEAGAPNYWHNLRARVEAVLAPRLLSFRPDAATWGLPFPFRLMHGTLMASALQPASIEIIPLPQEPAPMAGVIKRTYALQAARFPIAGTEREWVVVNLHLSAFDDDGTVRIEQFNAVMDFAAKEYARGHYVVLGGDWNMRLLQTDFPHTTEDEFLFWLMDLPQTLPEGWQVVADTTLPSVRTLHRPYVAGDNYTTIIDGFIVSPNVSVVSVETLDTGFRHADHMPGTARFRAEF